MDGSFSRGTDPIISHTPPAGFVSKIDGIYVERMGKDEVVTLDWLCSPIAVLALGRNTDSSGWCRWIELLDADGVVHHLHVPEKELSGSFSKVLARLRDRGFNVASGTAARKSLNELLVKWKPARRYNTTDRLGWVDKTCKNFVLGNGRVLGEKEVVFLNDVASARAAEMRSNGALEEWRNEVARRCSGNPIMLTAVSLAFAGPLVEFLGRESVGVHLRGRSSCGKTTSAQAAVSVWGSPRFMHSWRTTANALEATAASCNGSLLMLDEIAEVNQADFILTLLSVFWEEGRRELEEFCRASRVVPTGASTASPFNHFIQPDPDQLLRVAVAYGFGRGRLKSVYQVLRGKDPDMGTYTAERRDAQFEVLKRAQANVLNLTNWHQFLSALIGAGFRSREMISSNNALLFSYAFYLMGRVRYQVPEHQLQKSIGRWFFAVSLTGRYTSSPETVLDADLARFRTVERGEDFLAILDGIIENTLTNDFWEITLPAMRRSGCTTN